MAYSTITPYKGFTLLDITEQALWHLGQVTANAVSYARYPKAIVTQEVNRAMHWVNRQVPSLLKVGILNTTAGQGWYKCPPNMIPGGIVRAYYKRGDNELVDLKLWDRSRLDYHYPGWRSSEAGYPEVLVPGISMYGNRLTVEIYPRVVSGGTWHCASMNFLAGAYPARSRTISGMGASSASASRIRDRFITDFIAAGVMPMQMVWNMTPGNESWAAISTVTATQITTVGMMAHGIDSGIQYEIGPDYVAVVSDWNHDDDDQWIYANRLPSASTMHAATNNIVMEYHAMPVHLTADTDSPQVSSYLHDAIIYKTVAQLAGMGHEKVRMQALADRYEAMAGRELVPYLNMDSQWPALGKQDLQMSPKFGSSSKTP